MGNKGCHKKCRYVDGQHEKYVINLTERLHRDEKRHERWLRRQRQAMGNYRPDLEPTTNVKR